MQRYERNVYKNPYAAGWRIFSWRRMQVRQHRQAADSVREPAGRD